MHIAFTDRTSAQTLAGTFELPSMFKKVVDVFGTVKSPNTIPMRVLVISATFPPTKSGGADYAFHFCEHLAESGMEVHVVTSCIENVKLDPSMNVYPAMPNWSWLGLPRLLRLARRIKPDVINLHFTGLIYGNHPMITFALSFLKRRHPRARVVTLIEYPTPVNIDHLSRVSMFVYRVAARWIGTKDIDQGYGSILRDSDRVIVLSGAHSSSLGKHLAGVESKCVLIPPPPLFRTSAEPDDVARKRGRARLGVAPTEFLLMYYGYVYPQKGIETLLAAFRLVTSRIDKVRLAIVGGGNEVILKNAGRPQYVEELEEMTAQMGISDRVVWTGYCPNNEAPDYFNGADSCVLPFNIGVYLNNSSFSAAAAHGLPIITTKGEIVEPVFKHEDNVMLCPPEDPEALASAILAVVTNPELQKRLREGARRLSGEWLSWDRAMERTIEAFTGEGKRPGETS